MATSEATISSNRVVSSDPVSEKEIRAMWDLIGQTDVSLPVSTKYPDRYQLLPPPGVRRILQAMDEFANKGKTSATKPKSKASAFPQWLEAFQQENPNAGIVYSFPRDVETAVAEFNAYHEKNRKVNLQIAVGKGVGLKSGIVEENLNNAETPVNVLHTNYPAGAFVPVVKTSYVPFGHYQDVARIVESEIFAPIWVSGLAGNGKTTMIEQICANLKREFFRVNITEETEEDDLIGGFRLVNGNMVFVHGPVVLAMIRGAILCLDEIDLGSPKLLCIQSVLEGNPIFLKKIGLRVYPAQGFNIIATANTSGRGDSAGRFAAAQVSDERMLDRFSVTFRQDYPPMNVEKDILSKHVESLGGNSKDYADIVSALVTWADHSRKLYRTGDMNDVITTRRLIDTVTMIAITGDPQKAVAQSIQRFDDEMINALTNFWKSQIDFNKYEVPKEPKTPRSKKSKD